MAQQIDYDRLAAQAGGTASGGTVTPRLSSGQSPVLTVGGRRGRFNFDVPPETGGTPSARYAFDTEDGGRWFFQLENDLQGGRWEDAEHARDDYNRYLKMPPQELGERMVMMWGDRGEPGQIASIIGNSIVQRVPFDVMKQRLRQAGVNTHRQISDGEPGEPTRAAAGVDYDALAQQFQGTSTERPPDFRSETDGMIKDSPADALRGLWNFINPLPAVKTIVTEYAKMDPRTRLQLGPVGPLAPIVKGLGRAHLEQLEKGKQAFDEGRYSEMLGHLTAAGIPGIGPALAGTGEKYGEGKFFEATGELLSLGLVPAMRALRGRSVGLPPLGRNQNPAEAAAVRFGQSQGIPVDAATATGNPAVRGAQFLADRSLGGSIVSTRAARQTDDALVRVGNELAGDVNATGASPTTRVPGQPVTGEQAGQAVRQGVTKAVTDYADEANTAYEALRQIEAKAKAQPRSVQPGAPFQSMRMAVDVRPTKTATKPLYDQLLRESELVPLQGDKARALTALDRLHSGPDFQSLSIVDAALGDMKAFTRSGRAGQMPAMRTSGQGAIAQAVKALDDAVMEAARKEGPAAVNALQAGRRATVNKYVADEVLQSLSDEPVRVFNQATWAKDAGIERLREIKALAPDALPQLGRAYIEDLLATATAEGGFGRTQSIWTKWNNLGPETKRLLFQNPSNASALDQFFLLAKKIKENPNPSGTAFTASVGAQGFALAASPVIGVMTQLGAAGLSALLHSPRAVRALNNGLRLTLNGTRAAQATAASEILAISNELGVQAARAAETREAQSPAIVQR